MSNKQCKMKKLFILLLCAGVLSCSSVKTVFDYEKEVDFTKFKSYGLTENDLEEAVGPVNQNRIISSLEEELIGKGLTKSDDPDLLVDVHIKSEQIVEANAASSVGYGSVGWQTANSGSYLQYDKYTEGSMFITMADNDSKIVVWQGVGTTIIDDSATGEEREEKIREIVQGILSNYPYGK